jgi:hypothetical protein
LPFNFLVLSVPNVDYSVYMFCLSTFWLWAYPM